MIRSRSSDGGQAFPIYVVTVACLLFAALAFFVIGQASVTRSNGQGAADAAALAAARDLRDQLAPGLDLESLTAADWEALLAGNRFDVEGACGGAESFAAQNDAVATCVRRGLTFKVEVTTNGTVGDSIIPGTSGVHGKAKATAVVEPLCRLGSVVVPPEVEPTPTGSPTREPAPSASAPEPERPGPITIDCGGDDISFDPSKPERWDKLARRLFKVRLDS
ncbi:pilus assembly protein TadG-related protein [Streptomyces sp. NPDC054904]|uniref:pilus assembly protein TadG-related protein n=1 Tax=unclassified Streptomyces TaxID=2593676 RepID=UPI002481B0D3|nr:pilus assembly protein TadG-related protein [Streptomyces sp. Isolate_45]MDA5280477.1 pilus assembly protein TadG-related protein [Streptomyces sp. Isolate_45]